MSIATFNPKFDYNDRVRVRMASSGQARLGALAWIVGVFLTRPAGPYFTQFPSGNVYTIEYEDGSSHEIHEDDLEMWPDD